MSKFGVSADHTEGNKRPKPLPEITPFAQEFWEGTKKGELRIQRCRSCGHSQWIPRPNCEECSSRDLASELSSLSGVVYSFTIIRQVVMNSSAFEAELPFALAVIELSSGVRMIAQVVGVEPEKVSIGMKVEAAFEDLSDKVAVPKFHPVV